MPTNVSLLPLPGFSSLLQGRYGIEQCCVRGFVRIAHEPAAIRLGTAAKPLRIQQLEVVLSGKATTAYTDVAEGLDTVTRENVLLHKQVSLLTEVETVPPGSVLDIPFEIPFPPDPDPDSLPPPPPGTNPSPHLLPPSMACMGRQASTINSYTGKISYEVIAKLTEVPSVALGLFALSPTVRTATASLNPFCVYDPRLLPTLLHPDIRRWRSAPGAVPVEYDVEVGAIAMGPGDSLRFAYRIVVAPESARKGVRLKRVCLSLREHHVIGEQRCQGLPDDPYNPIERVGTRVKGMSELLRWEQSESVPESTESEYELSDFRSSPRHSPRTRPLRIPPSSSSTSDSTQLHPQPSPPRHPEKHPLPRPGFICRGGDGLSAESETMLHIPSTGGFAPTTAKPLPPTPIPPHNLPPPAHIETRHSLQVSIDFYGADKLVMESGCVLASVGREECGRVVDEDPEIVPVLDYEKVVGVELWVPEYRERESVAEMVEGLSEETVRAIRAMLRADGADGEFDEGGDDEHSTGEDEDAPYSATPDVLPSELTIHESTPGLSHPPAPAAESADAGGDDDGVDADTDTSDSSDDCSEHGNDLGSIPDSPPPPFDEAIAASAILDPALPLPPEDTPSSPSLSSSSSSSLFSESSESAECSEPPPPPPQTPPPSQRPTDPLSQPSPTRVNDSSHSRASPTTRRTPDLPTNGSHSPVSPTRTLSQPPKEQRAFAATPNAEAG
ncbi:uncharacterized protein EV422DRAFT_566041 [Fimicolochytrium jonesii]|uniref:uncharacterized protein n=1 Tax=Fimicolochytrium jonesii TaxID=1396493 RepID=UPI0022FE3BEC|nr:uncharacterized protein EV422DRAFT_566041 [Fimicolochytrium jonesii]KAI8823183.1 hypothetical protein EV422DRAFT_566041 [Fimicolochytrium jonesii]